MTDKSTVYCCYRWIRALLFLFHLFAATNDITSLNATTDFIYGNNQSAGAASKLTAFFNNFLFRRCTFLSCYCLFRFRCQSHLLLLILFHCQIVIASPSLCLILSAARNLDLHRSGSTPRSNLVCCLFKLLRRYHSSQ